MLMSGLNVGKGDQAWVVRAWGGEVVLDSTISDWTARARVGSRDKGRHVNQDEREHFPGGPVVKTLCFQCGGRGGGTGSI